MKHGKLHIVVFMVVQLALCSTSVFAQHDSVQKAVSIIQDQNITPEKRVATALEIIDRAILHPQCAKDAYAWYVRGYIYKERYKLLEIQNTKSKTRLDAIGFLKKASQLDTAKTFQSSINGSLKWLAIRFYNDAASFLDSVNYSTAIQYYELFKENILLADPSYNIKPSETEFNKTLALIYVEIFRKNTTANQRFYGMAEGLYKQVLVADTNEYVACYNLSMLYYNYGVDIIQSMSLETPLAEVEQLLDKARDEFTKAVPYALKSDRIKPNRKEIYIALQGIYWCLYEFEKSDYYKAKIELLDKK